MAEDHLRCRQGQKADTARHPATSAIRGFQHDAANQITFQRKNESLPSEAEKPTDTETG